MALPFLASFPVTFNKILYVEKKSLVKTKTKIVPSPIQSKACIEVSDDTQTTLRRCADFKPTVWHYDYIQSLNSEYKEQFHTEQSKVLKEEVRMMLFKATNHVDQLELIDVLQRLGVAYHFEDEIRNILENLYNVETFVNKNLYETALHFRLLRQHGFNLSTDAFDSFHDETGYFKKCQPGDVEGTLSLYEASFLSLETEPILDEARNFTQKILEEYVNNNKGNHMSLLINHALELPFHWRVPRWEARWFIDVNERSNIMNPKLLQFAKLDFNMVQAIHQEELQYISRWWKKLGVVENLNFSRDRLIESYFWGFGMNFRPELGYFRRIMPKVMCLITTIDDIYDVYGTMEELELFTDIIDRWDVKAMENLPKYMKTCFFALDNFVNEVAFETFKETGTHIVPYLRKVWADSCKSYFIEAKWYHSGYTPTMEEYIENAWITACTPVMLVHAYFLVSNSFKEDDLEEYPKLIRLSALLLRLANDLVTSERESETGDVPKAIECYMNETKVPEAKAREHIKSMISTTWKMMNQEVQNSSFSHCFNEIAINLARTALCFYLHGDGYTVQDPETNNRILSLIMQPIPMKGSEIVVKI